MTITVVFDPPLPSDSPATFNTKAFATLGDLNDWSTEANDLAAEINSGVPLATATHAATSKTTPVDADEIPMSDSAASWGLKKLTWANIKATAKTYFDTLYQAVGTYVTPTTLNNGTLPASVTTLATSGNTTLGNATTDTLNVGNGEIVKASDGKVSIGAGTAPVARLEVGRLGSALPITNVHAQTAVLIHPGGGAATSGVDIGTVAQDSGQAGIRLGKASDAQRAAILYDAPTDDLIFFSGGMTQRMRIDTNGNVLVKSAAGLGYGTGAGGTVTQATSKGTGVTLNKPCGQITMNNSALAAGAGVGFILTNSAIASVNGDTVVVNVNSFAVASYSVRSGQIGAGQCAIYLNNETAGSLSDAVVIQFAVIKGATS